MSLWARYAAVGLAIFFMVIVVGRGVPASPAPSASGGSGYDLANLDRSAAPCKDFYAYAVGGWLKAHSIPAEYPRWGLFQELNARNDEILRKICERDAAAHAARGSNEQKVGDFYASGMDEAAVERAGLSPLRPTMGRIDAVTTMQAAGELIADLQADGIDALFHLSAGPDDKNSQLVIAELGQGGLGLPGRDYYVGTDAASVKLREQYQAYVTKILTLGGTDAAQAAQDAARILELETRLATAASSRVQLRDPVANYHRMTLAEVMQSMPHFDWTQYANRLALSKTTPVNLGQPAFFTALDGALASVPPPVWKAYLRFHALDAYAPALSAPFVQANFEFRGKIFNGTQQLLPRWKRVLRTVDGEIGEALGKEFVAVAFPPQARASALQLVNNLRAALKEDIEKLDWMGPATKKEALAKLAAMREKIGYPDRWRDYSAVDITRDSYVTNITRAERADFLRRLRQIGKPPDRSEWHMTPQTVNAYYNPSLNEIVFPAGILQPPFFDAKADDAVNYGGIGAVIGHEMTHGFDDKGSQYDASGNLRNWWTEEDRTRFAARAKCIEDEFSSFEVEAGLHVQGKLVEGESIADLGGLTLSWMAWQKSLHGRPAPSRDGFTAAQLFFLGYAQIWAQRERPEYARLLTRTNPHPLPRFRVNGTVSNMPAFWSAFGCKADDPMERVGDRHCQIW